MITTWISYVTYNDVTDYMTSYDITTHAMACNRDKTAVVLASPSNLPEG